MKMNAEELIAKIEEQGFERMGLLNLRGDHVIENAVPNDVLTANLFEEIAELGLPNLSEDFEKAALGKDLTNTLEPLIRGPQFT